MYGWFYLMVRPRASRKHTSSSTVQLFVFSSAALSGCFARKESIDRWANTRVWRRNDKSLHTTSFLYTMDARILMGDFNSLRSSRWTRHDCDIRTHLYTQLCKMYYSVNFHAMVTMFFLYFWIFEFFLFKIWNYY